MESIQPAFQPRVPVCVGAARRRRLSEALGGWVAIEPHDSFAALEHALAAGAPPAFVIIESRDALSCEPRGLLQRIAGRPERPPVVLYGVADELPGVMTSEAISDIIVVDRTDKPEMLRLLARRLMIRGAAEKVVVELRRRLSAGVANFAEAAVRHPDCTSVQAVSDRLGVQRQTLALWCRKERGLHPEEIIVWARLLLIGAALEDTGCSATRLADDLHFPSVVALRNQLKRYTGLTAQEVRAAGFDRLLAQFDAALAEKHFGASVSTRRQEPVEYMVR